MFSLQSTMLHWDKCKCGKQKDDNCHTIPHTCLICGESFTAIENTSTSCLKHPFKIKIIGTRSNAHQQYQTYIYECCPNKTSVCSDERTFIAKRIPHGPHT
mmetsp:Transcript_59676/g.158826  ORF Transcript_59676/g.158826 Transcript_59676/m.158826 type:complete len:101 (-) Transcript_59676:261-563(-)